MTQVRETGAWVSSMGYGPADHAGSCGALDTFPAGQVQSTHGILRHTTCAGHGQPPLLVTHITLLQVSVCHCAMLEAERLELSLRLKAGAPLGFSGQNPLTHAGMWRGAVCLGTQPGISSTISPGRETVFQFWLG